VLYFQNFNTKKVYSFQNLSLGFIIKISQISASVLVGDCPRFFNETLKSFKVFSFKVLKRVLPKYLTTETENITLFCLGSERDIVRTF